MYVILGANGNTGSVVANTLLDRGKQVRVVVRDAAKVEAMRARGAEVVVGDVLDLASLRKAFDGAEGAYLLAPPDNTSNDLVARGKRIFDHYVTALLNSTVRHAVVLSSIGAQHPAGTGPIVITNHAETVLPRVKDTRFTFVRAAYFMENLVSYAHPMKHDGVLPVFGGGESYPFPMVATRDVGIVSADALLAPPPEHDWIELSGPKEYSMNDVASEASAVTGRPVKVMPLPIDAMEAAFMQHGASANVAGLYREMTEAAGRGLLAWQGKGRSVRGTTLLAHVLRPALT